MMYSDMILDAKAKGLTTETMMLESVEDLDVILCQMKKEHPKEYWMFLRKQHGRLYKNHYTEEFAEHDVSKMEWTDRNGHEQKGAHWSKEQIKEATKSDTFPSGTTECDKYVAYNATYADLCRVLDDEHILKVAHQFWFADEDAQDGKIWLYMCAMYEHKEHDNRI